MTNLSLVQINVSIIILLVVSVVIFYYLKFLLNSIVKGFLYTVIIAFVLFFLGMWYFFGLSESIDLIRKFLHI